MMIFTGNANPTLAHSVAQHLGVPMGQATVGCFSDGEIMVEVHDNVRGQEVFIVQSTHHPTDTHLMELLLLTDTLRRASAGRITAVIPYFGYARQDRRIRSARVPISAKLVADMLVAAGVNRVLTVDLHAEQIQGFFNIPVDNAYASVVLLSDLQEHPLNNPIVVSPDIGGVVRARALAKRLSCDLAIIDKRRPQANEAQVMNVIGDVADRSCILVDDIIDTAGTLAAAAHALKKQGAQHVVAYCTHPVLSGRSLHHISHAPLDDVVVTDTIPLAPEALQCPNLRQLSLAGMLSEAIRRISQDESVSSMFS